MQDAYGHVYMLIIRKWFPWFWGLSPKSCSPLGEPVCGSSVSSKTWDPGTRSMNPSLKAGGLEARESQFFRPGLKAGGRRFYVIQTFSSLQAFHGLEEAYPHSGGRSTFSSPDSNANLIPSHSHRHILKCLTKYLGTPWSSKFGT